MYKIFESGAWPEATKYICWIIFSSFPKLCLSGRVTVMDRLILEDETQQYTDATQREI